MLDTCCVAAGCWTLLHTLQVRHLSLHFNALTSLPVGLAGASSLVWLSLNANRLTRLPPELCNLPDLQRLSLHINQVRVHWGGQRWVCRSQPVSSDCTLTRHVCVPVDVNVGFFLQHPQPQHPFKHSHLCLHLCLDWLLPPPPACS